MSKYFTVLKSQIDTLILKREQARKTLRESFDTISETTQQIMEIVALFPKRYGRCIKPLSFSYCNDFPLMNTVTINVGDLVWFSEYPARDAVRYHIPGSLEAIDIKMDAEYFDLFDSREDLEVQF